MIFNTSLENEDSNPTTECLSLTSSYQPGYKQVPVQLVHAKLEEVAEVTKYGP